MNRLDTKLCLYEINNFLVLTNQQNYEMDLVKLTQLECRPLNFRVLLILASKNGNLKDL